MSPSRPTYYIQLTHTSSYTRASQSSKGVSANNVQKEPEEPTYIRYAPDPSAPGYSDAAKQRVIRMVEAQVTPYIAPYIKPLYKPLISHGRGAGTALSDARAVGPISSVSAL